MIIASPGGGMRSGAGSGPGCTGWWRARAGGGSGLLHTVLLQSAAVTECHTVAPGASNDEEKYNNVPHPPS